jgi:beta-lactamase regulating signal transducer with metallopeptidase domain
MNILHMSISAGLFVITVVLIRAVALHRLPKKMFLALWGVVLFRLLMPVSIPLPFSAPNIFANFGEALKMALSDSSVPFVIDNPANTGETVTGTAGNIAEAAQEQFFNIAPTTAIWLVGMLALFIFFAVIYFRNHRRLRYATSIRDNGFLNEWLTENKLPRTIAIMQSDRIISPLAVGIFRPRIILPKSMNMSDKQLLDYVLAHECYHIKRHDALWKIILLLALCVHWFNPMVWVMFVLASRDLELTCDEAVIHRFGTKTKKAYAYMLIGMAEQQGAFAPLYNGFSRNATEERIVSIMKIKKVSRIWTILAIALVSVITIGMLSGFASPSGDKSDALEIGRYIHESGDPNKYIEVYPDGTLQLFGFDYYEFSLKNDYPDAGYPEFCQQRNDVMSLRKPYYTQISREVDEDNTQNNVIIDEDNNRIAYVTYLFVGDDESNWSMVYIDRNTLRIGKDEVFAYSRP